jgi:NAD(P)-dependent dehydrogenase (short-subunit alcohol dehydrogenase family)
MDVQGKVAVVTGAASGIGLAVARRFSAEGAAAVVLADLDLGKTQALAEQFGGLAMACDVSQESEIKKLVWCWGMAVQQALMESLAPRKLPKLLCRQCGKKHF